MGDHRELTVRRARPDDADRVSSVISASYDRLYRGWYDDETLAAVLPAMARAKPELLAGGTYFLAEVCGEAAACGGWTREDPALAASIAARCHIRHFATHPDFLRRGAASAVMGACLDTARATGVREFECLSSLPAEPFYAALGFRTIEFKTVRLRSGYDFATVLMRRALV